MQNNQQENKYKRNSTYREVYMKKYPPKKKGYLCVYCGRWVPYLQMEVDHVFSVSMAERHVVLRRWIIPNGVNDISNLVSACHKCNSRKGKKFGIWYLRGKHWHFFLPFSHICILCFRLVCFFLVWDIGTYFLNRYALYI